MPAATKPTRGKGIYAEIPPDLHRRLRLAAAEAEVSIARLIETAVRIYLGVVEAERSGDGTVKP